MNTSEYYNSPLRFVFKGIAQISLVLIMLLAAWFISFGTSEVNAGGIIIGIFILLISFIPFMLSLYSFMHIAKKNRLAISIKPEGLILADKKSLVPWSDIDMIAITCWRQPGGSSSIAMNAMNYGTNHITVKLKNSDASKRFVEVAYDNELSGGYKSFIKLSNELLKIKDDTYGFKVRLLESGRPWVHKDLGNPPTTTLEEINK